MEQQQSKRKMIWFWAILGAFYLAMLLLNFITPLVSDDYRYCFSFATGERITSVWQIFPSLAAHYTSQHGRIFVHFFVQLMLLVGKPVFNFINAGVAALLLLGIYRMASRLSNKEPFFLLVIAAVLIVFTPAFGQTMLWLDGACNYLWGITLIVWVLVPVRDAMVEQTGKPSGRMLALLFIGSLLAGATSENNSPAAIAFIGLCWLTVLVRERRLSGWMFLCIALAVAGWLSIVLSPGTIARNAYQENPTLSALGQKMVRFQNVVAAFEKEQLVLSCAYIFLFAMGVVLGLQREKLRVSAFFFVAALLADLVLIFSNYLPTRSLMGSSVFILAACGMLLFPLLQTSFRALLAGACACVVLLALVTAARILPDNYTRFRLAQTREQYVVEQQAAGNLDVTTYSIEGKSPYDVYYDLSDISNDETYFPNVYYAKYYGLNSVVTDTIR
ncbi:MAG TPA: DUF6056 family protein [Candidatus Limiplasma sp.]|nr:DUF6056 family protein [Candidatus Limiplasma sp.]